MRGNDKSILGGLQRVVAMIALLLLLGKLLHLPGDALQMALAQGSQGQVYIVQLDDTLWKVAEKYLGDGHRFEQIVAATQAKRAEVKKSAKCSLEKKPACSSCSCSKRSPACC